MATAVKSVSMFITTIRTSAGDFKVPMRLMSVLCFDL